MSDRRLKMTHFAFDSGTLVKVQRSGNSKVLPIPAEVSRLEHVETGQPYVLEIVGDGFLYRRSGPKVAVLRIDGESIGVIPSGAVMGVAQDSSLLPLDWDF
jgi:antitoxin component of MazEF toxin-antitoxin module